MVRVRAHALPTLIWFGIGSREVLITARLSGGTIVGGVVPVRGKYFDMEVHPDALNASVMDGAAPGKRP